ncbi:MAG: TetR/AcrR family transcriptional regulator [Fidelibacterota bacterium]
MQNPPNRILNSGLDLLRKVGLRFFTVDYLAETIGMSKKTIYKYFPTKADLINNMFDYFMEYVRKRFRDIINSDKNAIAKLVEIRDILAQINHRISIVKMVEVKARYPEIWHRIETFRQERRNDFAIILQQGQEEGYVSREKDANKLAGVMMIIINEIFQPETLVKYNLSFIELFDLFFDLIMEGFLTAQGKKVKKEMAHG